MAKLTTAMFIRKARAKHAGFYDYSKTVYDGAQSKVTIICPEHGEFQQLASDHANVGKGCKLCGLRRSSPAAFSTAEFVSRAREKHGDIYDYSRAVYKTYKKLVTIICRSHGEFQQRAGHHLRGNGCPVCRNGRLTPIYRAKTRQERAQEWRAASAKLHKGFYDYTQAEFVNSKTPVKIVCPTHGAFWQTPNNHLNGACRCPECASELKSDKTRKSTEDWIAGFRGVHGASTFDYTSAGDITSAFQRVSIKCPAHGVFLQQVYVHQQGFGCPRCVNKVSKPEDMLYEWIVAIAPNQEVRRSVRSVIPPYELDLYIPELKLAVEFNGTYWHCDTRKSKLYHQKKSLLCRGKGVRLIHVYEYDWNLRPDACKRLIHAQLRQECRRLHARSLELREVGDRADFLRDNHFQGSVAASVNYGLFDGPDLVALMTFGNARYSGNHTWELLRFCSLAGVRVRGGASRLFAQFAREHLCAGDTVISYARLDYSAGDVYTHLGFTETGVCAPDYVWIKAPTTVLKRQATQKHRLPRLLGDKFNANKSESANMRDAGYKRVYTAGNLRYEYRHA